MSILVRGLIQEEDNQGIERLDIIIALPIGTFPLLGQTLNLFALLPLSPFIPFPHFLPFPFLSTPHGKVRKFEKTS